MKLSATMEYYLLRGQRNLSLAKAKEMAELTKTDVMVWIDPERADERQSAWDKLYPTESSE